MVKEDPPQSQELLTPKPEPVEVPISKQSDPEPEAEESSSSDPPSSPEVKKKGKTKDLRKPGPPRQRSNCCTCGICHSWFPERDEYVLHMKKEHGKVRNQGGGRVDSGGPGAVAHPLSSAVF